MPRRGKRKIREPSRGTLHVYRMQEKEAQAARKNVSRKHQRKQRKLSAKTLCLRQFVCVFPSPITYSLVEKQHWHSIAVAGKLHERLQEGKAFYLSISCVPNSVAS